MDATLILEALGAAHAVDYFLNKAHDKVRLRKATKAEELVQ